jgi:hypothetical protein
MAYTYHSADGKVQYAETGSSQSGPNNSSEILIVVQPPDSPDTPVSSASGDIPRMSARMLRQAKRKENLARNADVAGKGKARARTPDEDEGECAQNNTCHRRVYPFTLTCAAEEEDTEVKKEDDNDNNARAASAPPTQTIEDISGQIPQVSGFEADGNARAASQQPQGTSWDSGNSWADKQQQGWRGNWKSNEPDAPSNTSGTWSNEPSEWEKKGQQAAARSSAQSSTQAGAQTTAQAPALAPERDEDMG